MHAAPSDEFRWWADYEEWLPRCTESLRKRSPLDELAWGAAPRRQELLPWIGAAADEDWRPELAKLEAHAHSVLGDPGSQLRSLNRSLRIGAFPLFLWFATPEGEQTGDHEEGIIRAGERFIHRALELSVPVPVSDSISAFQEALGAIVQRAADGDTAGLDDAVVRAGAEAVRLAYLLSAGRRGFGPAAATSRPSPGDPYLFDVVRDHDPYWRAEPEGVRLIVMPRSEARRLAAFRRTVLGSSTWGEVLEKIEDPLIYEHVMSEFADLQDWGADCPNAAVSELSIDLGEVGEDFIPDPKQEMLRWLPDSVQRLGRVIDEEGPWLHLEESALGEVLQALAAEDYEAYEDPGDDVRTACWWS